MNDKEKIVWDSMISTMVMGKVIPIKIIDADQFENENRYINNLDESCLKEVGVKLAFEIDDYIIRNILKNSKFTNNGLSFNSISDAMENLASNLYSPNIIFLEDKSILNSLPELTRLNCLPVHGNQVNTLLGMEILDLESTYYNFLNYNEYNYDNYEAIIFDKNQIGIIRIVEKIEMHLEYELGWDTSMKLKATTNTNFVSNESSAISILKCDK